MNKMKRKKQSVIEDLKALQRQVVEVATAAASGKVTDLPEHLKKEICPSGRLSSVGALRVYGRSAEGGLFEALGETYEACWRVLGDEDFLTLCRDYISKHPSSLRNLKDYGESFPGFLSESHHSQDFPFLEDLARFEWTFKNLFHLKREPAICPTGFQILEENSNVNFSFIGAHSLFSSSYSIFEIWKLRNQEPEESQEADVIDDWNQPSFLLLYKGGEEKDEGMVQVKSLDRHSFDLLKALKDGTSFEKSIEELEIKNLESQASHEIIQELMQTLVWSGLVASIDSCV
jgi:hypothetical protein